MVTEMSSENIEEKVTRYQYQKGNIKMYKTQMEAAKRDRNQRNEERF